MADEQLTDGLEIALAEERLVVSKRVIETGRVRLNIVVDQYTQQVRETLRHEDVAIERVAIGRAIEVVPELRVEGDTTVYPVVEERLVLLRQLFLKEELRVIRRVRMEPFEQDVLLRRERAEEERLTPPFPTSPAQT